MMMLMMMMTNILMPPSHVHTCFQCEIWMLPLFAIFFPPRHFFATLPRARRTNLSPRHNTRIMRPSGGVTEGAGGSALDRWANVQTNVEKTTSTREITNINPLLIHYYPLVIKHSHGIDGPFYVK